MKNLISIEEGNTSILSIYDSANQSTGTPFNLHQLQIFEKKELVQLRSASNRIVETLSINYTSIIDNMIGKAATTKTTYKRNVEHFLSFIQKHGINSQSYGAFHRELEGVELVSVKTKNAYLAAAKALIRESLKYGILPIDITVNVPSFKVSTGHTKDGIMEDEVFKVWDCVSRIQREATRRKVSAMLQLFTGEGFRQMEVQQILIEDINFKDGTIMIRGKGETEKKPILIYRFVADELKEYVEFLGRKEGFLFASPSNSNKPITLRAIRKIFTCPKYGIFKKSGVTARSVHGFRHFFTTKTLDENGGDIRKTQLRTRHKTAATVQVYDDRRMNRNEMKRTEEAFNLKSQLFDQSI